MELSGDGKRPASWEDAAVTLALDYILALNKAGSDAERAHIEQRMPDVAAAFGLHVEAGPACDEIQARLLAGQSIDAIAGKVGIPARLVEIYERLFFHVSDALKASDWLFQQAVGIYVGMRRAPTRGETWKYMALAAGPAAVDMLVADYHGRDEPRIHDRDLLAEKARFLVWECTRGFSLPETAAVLAGYLALLGQPPSDADDTPARQELKQLVDQLKTFVDLWATAVANVDAEQRTSKKANRRRRTADKKETAHGRAQNQEDPQGQDSFTEFPGQASGDLTAERGG
jgi:hypothetical protein